MTKLSDEQIKENEKAISNWIRASNGNSVRALANFLHFAERYGLSANQCIDEARAIYRAETTFLKKMVTKAIAGHAAIFAEKSTCSVVIDKPIPPGTQVLVTYETEEEGE